MSYTTMSMSARRIWGFDGTDTEMKLARKAGWDRSDLAWERLMEAANLAWAEKRGPRARRLFTLAHLLARLRFAAGDPRRATALAARAKLHAAMGRMGRAQALARQAQAEWGGTAGFIASLEIKPRARSSLFHLRMEARHRDTFHDNMRVRFTKFAEETAETLNALANGDAGAPPHRHFSRWRGEKPMVFDGTRKILAACLLMPD